MSEVVIRQATAADIPDLLRLRRMMFEAMGYADCAQLDAADAACAAYFAEAIPYEKLGFAESHAMRLSWRCE